MLTNTVCVSIIYVSAIGIRAQAYVVARLFTTVRLCVDDSRGTFPGSGGGQKGVEGVGVAVVAGGGTLQLSSRDLTARCVILLNLSCVQSSSRGDRDNSKDNSAPLLTSASLE